MQATALRWQSVLSHTTTLRPSSLIKVLRPESEESFETSSRWALAQSPSWIRCSLVRRRILGSAGCSKESSLEYRGMATRWACRPLVENSPLTLAMPVILSSTCCVSVHCQRSASCSALLQERATWRFCSDHELDEMALAVCPSWPRQDLAKTMTSPSVQASKLATLMRRSVSLRRALRSSMKSWSLVFRTLVAPALSVQRPRRRPEAGLAWTSTLMPCRLVNSGWNLGKS